MSHVITFGRSDGSAIKHIFPHNRTEALDIANCLSFVLFHEHSFKSSECHKRKRVEREGFFVEFDFVRNKK
jgi:hypothetical protein